MISLKQTRVCYKSALKLFSGSLAIFLCELLTKSENVLS
ncbi:hypothetical protein ECP03018678_0947, partial [Escherichia coli P0301867.8]